MDSMFTRLEKYSKIIFFVKNLKMIQIIEYLLIQNQELKVRFLKMKIMEIKFTFVMMKIYFRTITLSALINMKMKKKAKIL